MKYILSAKLQDAMIQWECGTSQLEAITYTKQTVVL